MPTLTRAGPLLRADQRMAQRSRLACCDCGLTWRASTSKTSSLSVWLDAAHPLGQLRTFGSSSALAAELADSHAESPARVHGGAGHCCSCRAVRAGPHEPAGGIPYGSTGTADSIAIPDTTAVGTAHLDRSAAALAAAAGSGWLAQRWCLVLVHPPAMVHVGKKLQLYR